jgi:ABC-type branched-subunit amino acid transport system ATPase component
MTGLPLLSLRNLRVAFDGLFALDVDQWDMSVVPNRLHLLMGPNGAGKSSFLNAVTGYVGIARDGRVTLYSDRAYDLAGLAPYEIVRRGIARTFQTPAVFPSLTTREAMLLAWLNTSRVPWYHRIFRRNGLGSTPPLVRRLLDGMGLSPCEDLPHTQLPLHLVRRAELARCLSTQPRLLFLDEPTAGADELEREWLVRLLVLDLPQLVAELHALGLYCHPQITIGVVTHDLHFVRDLRHSNLSMAPLVHILDQGKFYTTASVDDVMQDPRIQRMYLGGG